MTLACVEKTKNESFTELNSNAIKKLPSGPKFCLSRACRIGQLVLTNGWNVGVITLKTGVITEYSGQATTRSNLNLMLSANGYIPYSYNSVFETFDEYAKSFFKLVQFKDE